MARRPDPTVIPIMSPDEETEVCRMVRDLVSLVINENTERPRRVGYPPIHRTPAMAELDRLAAA